MIKINVFLDNCGFDEKNEPVAQTDANMMVPRVVCMLFTTF